MLLPVLLGAGVLSALYLASRKGRSGEVTLEAGETYAITLDIGDENENDVASVVADAGGILDLDSPTGTIKFEMRPGITTTIHVPGSLEVFPGFGDTVVVTQVERLS